MPLLIATYYPENKDYEKLLKPINDLRRTLGNLGFDIKTVPLLGEATVEDPVSTTYEHDEILNSLPMVYDRINERVEEARRKKIVIDVRTFGIRHRFIKDIVVDNRVKLLSPSSWSGENPRSKPNYVIY
ncbi:MAG: hypothetical protein AAB390_01630 [Patescibacteria group bacterium]